MIQKQQFAQLLLPLPLPGYFTYSVPAEMRETLKVGVRVVVQFGKKKLYTALVRHIHEEWPGLPVKEIISQLDLLPVVNAIQFDFWQWLSEYYMCTMGEVMNAALPPSLKLSSETRIVLHPDFDADYKRFTEREYRIITVLEQRKEITVGDVAQIAGLLTVMPLINSLIEKKAIEVFEEMVERFKPKTEKFYQLADTYHRDEKALSAILDYLEKRAKRQNILLLSILHQLENQNDSDKGISKPELLKNPSFSEAALRSLIEKGLITETERNVSRLENFDSVYPVSDLKLTEHQNQAYNQIQAHFANRVPVLLHGITSSGKTEIYIRLIYEVLRQGKQVLYLLPEIALTSQIINRLRRYFGDVVGVYHSRFGEGERAEVWNKVVAWKEPENGVLGSHSVILGARSALFLPFRKLGLVIVDEEHDSSYKQYDPNPRYHARDASVYLAQQHKANILLGSATPAIESFFNAQKNKYGLVSLTKRFGDIMLPEVVVADVKEATRRKQMKSLFTPTLLEALEQAIANKEQVILFQNRRGFSLRLECAACHHVPECKQCDVTLIYHKRDKHLRCHYCGYSEPVPYRCPKCGHPEMNLIGFGTEKVEEELALLYPELKIDRMDLDTTRSKYAHQRIISNFEARLVDVLTGTQMVTKGLDFDNVSLVGVLSADGMISFPDFRSFERSYQLMAQVSGRAGRKNKQGKVVIQTRNPQHPVIGFVMQNDYEGMYEAQIAERLKFNYPPYSRLLKLSLRHKEQEPLDKGAAVLASMLRKEFPGLVLGPEYPVVSKIRNYYIKEILVKLKRDLRLPESKKKIAQMIKTFLQAHKQIRVVTDVDPA